MLTFKYINNIPVTMSIRTETSGGAIRKHSAKYIGKITAMMLKSIAKKIGPVDKIRFSMGNIKNSNQMYIDYYPRHGLNQGHTWEDTKPLIITMYYPDGNSAKEERKMSYSDCAIFINKLWTDKAWQCKLQFTYYERPSEMSKHDVVIDVEYRNTKYSIAGPLNLSKKIGVIKVKPTIRTSRMPLSTTKSITKTKDINSLNGRKTAPSKNTVSKLVGVRPTKKCNFKKLI